jgi:hypothetical protein
VLIRRVAFALFCPFFAKEAKRKEGNREDNSGLPPLDSASSACARLERPLTTTDDSGQALDLPPNHRGSRHRAGFGGQLFKPSKKVAFGLIGRKEAPLAQASEADRNSAPGYSWPPHLYQEKSSVGHCDGKWQQKI